MILNEDKQKERSKITIMSCVGIYPESSMPNLKLYSFYKQVQEAQDQLI